MLARVRTVLHPVQFADGRSDMWAVHETRWVFGRGSERLTLERRGEGTLAVIKDSEPARVYEFGDVIRLTRHQMQMEEFLIHTGWSLQEFFPERRRGRDRRRFPRLTERRRWWTDPANLLPFPPRPDRRARR